MSTGPGRCQRRPRRDRSVRVHWPVPEHRAEFRSHRPLRTRGEDPAVREPRRLYGAIGPSRGAAIRSRTCSRSSGRTLLTHVPEAVLPCTSPSDRSWSNALTTVPRDTPCWRGEVATGPSRSYHCPVACRRCHPDHVITRGRYAAPPASARNDCWSRLSTCAVREDPGPRERGTCRTRTGSRTGAIRPRPGAHGRLASQGHAGRGEIWPR